MVGLSRQVNVQQVVETVSGRGEEGGSSGHQLKKKKNEVTEGFMIKYIFSPKSITTQCRRHQI